MSSIKFIRRISIILFFFSLSLLIVIPIFGTDFGKGAYRWLSLGFISFQPSELIKPFLMHLILASLLEIFKPINTDIAIRRPYQRMIIGPALNTSGPGEIKVAKVSIMTISC